MVNKLIYRLQNNQNSGIAIYHSYFLTNANILPVWYGLFSRKQKEQREKCPHVLLNLIIALHFLSFGRHSEIQDTNVYVPFFAHSFDQI